MDNAQKAIMIGVGLFITIIIISAVLLIVNLGTGLVDDATANLSSISSTLQSSILQNYDNKVLSGTQVRSALQQYMSSEDVSIVLANSDAKLVAGIGKYDLSKGTLNLGAGTVSIPTATYEAKATPSINSISQFTNVDRNSDTFVNASRQYESFIMYHTGTDAMVGILFIPQNATVPADGALEPKA